MDASTFPCWGDGPVAGLWVPVAQSPVREELSLRSIELVWGVSCIFIASIIADDLNFSQLILNERFSLQWKCFSISKYFS